MRIGIDARMYGLKHAGIGRYVENLIRNLLTLDKSNEYTLFVRKTDIDKFKIYSAKCKIVVADARHYTVKEQLLIPYLLEKEKLDLVHFPHFNVSLLYKGKFVVTIHDLLWHENKGKSVTTLSRSKYLFKYQGYRLVFKNAVKRAQKILVPSVWVKNKLVSTYRVNPDKIVVTYEGVDDKYLSSKVDKYSSVLIKYQITKPLFIYTGSAYPHKNLERLIEAIKVLNKSNKNVQLVIACARDVFRTKLEKMVVDNNLQNQVKLLGYVSDEDLRVLYKQAIAFVFPSLSEGFGLPGLEAMACGCPVVSSNAGSLPEVYGNAALYFDPTSEEDIERNLKLIMNNVKLRESMKKKGLNQAKKYSWKKLANETLKTYISVQ